MPGRAIRPKIVPISRNSAELISSYAPRGTTKVRIADSRARRMSSRPRTNTRTWIAIIAASVAGGRGRHVVRSRRRPRRRSSMPASDESLAAGRTYQQTLLAALGDDDPAVTQAAQPAILRALVAEAGDDLRTRPEPAEWSAVELIGHMVDAELGSSMRYRWILAEDEPVLVPYDQDLWANRLHSTGESLDDLLPVFDALRAA